MGKKITFERIVFGGLFVLALLLALGTPFLFHACGPKEDGSYMLCHWAQQAITGTAVVLVLTYGYLWVAKEKPVKRAILILSIPTILLTMLLPGTLIHMCMSMEMRCQSVMRPSVLVICGAMLLLTGAALWMNERKAR